MTNGINPVTIAGNGGTHLTLGRLWIKHGEKTEKLISAIMWRGDQFDDSPKEQLVSAVLDENTFLSGLAHLFPNGELLGYNRD